MRPALAIDPGGPRQMSLEEWGALGEDEPGELVDGVLVEEEVTTFLHEAVVSWLIQVLRAWALPRGGWVFGSEAKVAVGPRRGRKPDVTVFLGAVPTRKDALARVPPFIAVEVLSAGGEAVRRDRLDKLNDYRGAAIRHYWLIDPDSRTLEVLTLGEDGHYLLALAAHEGALSIPGCDDLVLRLDDLWAELDRLPPESAPSDS